MQHTPATPSQRAQEDIYYRSLRSRNLAAAGVLFSCTATAGDAFILFGLNSHDHFCHFHGRNDDQRSTDGGNKPYLETAFDTASREYAEEALEVVGTGAHIRSVLVNHPECWLQIFPHKSFNVRCFWMHLGTLSEEERDAILQKFKKARSSVFLLPSQREMSKLVWMRATDLIRAYSCDNYKDQIVEYVARGGTKGTCHGRGWIHGWFRDVFFSPDATESFGLDVFRRWCVSGGPAPISPIPK